MSQVAQVIVDVPTMQTNQAYSYSIPENLQEVVTIGSRVIVPFGHRKVQGFVVDFISDEKVNHALKDIEQLMDPEPVLTEELVELGRVMADETFSFLISCYLTMLPASLRANYKKWVVPKFVTPEIEEIFADNKKLSWEEIEQLKLEKKMIDLKNQGAVEIIYEVKDSVTKKTEDFLIPKKTVDELLKEKEKLSSRAYRQKQLIELLAQLEPGQEISIKELQKNYKISRNVAKVAVDKGWAKIETRELYRDPFQEKKVIPSSPLKLNKDQQVATDEIKKAMDQKDSEVFLLEGVTGSGKTEVYLQTIANALEQEKGALMLVPEIALTPQMAYRFKSRFGDQIAVLHSGLSDGEKYDEWRRIKQGEALVVVGARSSVFAPLKEIGLIVIDEEHEGSYKQEEHPRYHTRDVAIARAKYHHCPVVLGSATPSLESRARASKGVYKYLTLPERATKMSLPQVEVVDMRDEMEAGNFTIFSRKLAQELKKTLERNEQAVLLLNRRGYSNFAMCRDCGYIVQCPNCDISLTHHQSSHSLKCHYCGFEAPIPSECPVCHGKNIRYFGTGTQKVEEQLSGYLPEAKILRMDVDTTQKKGAYNEILEKFGRQEANILLGTQMIAKGLDFPNVTFVGVLNADTALGIPDFRSAEKTFQLLTQVSGRAGRGEVAGSVVVQTYNPDHYAIQLAKDHDYEKFYLQEMNYRHLTKYSPYYFMAKIEVSHRNERDTARKAQEIASFLKKRLSDDAIILGPSPRSIARINNQYYFQIIIKYRQEPNFHHTLSEILDESQKDYQQGYRVMIDNHPLNFM